MLTINNTHRKIHYRVILVFVSALGPLLLPAQNHPEDLLLSQLNMNALSQNNRLFIEQEGEFHRAINTVNGENNQLMTTQVGSEHDMSSKVVGSNNEFNVEQSGRQHDYNLDLTGDNNSLVIQQRGKGNAISQDLMGNNMDYSVTQNGENLELIQIENNSLFPTYHVEQQGQNMSVVIEQGFY